MINGKPCSCGGTKRPLDPTAGRLGGLPMAVIETFSKRKKKAALAGQPDVYQYDSLPQEFRVQVMHIWNSALGRFDPYDGSNVATRAWMFLANAIARESGLPYLGNDPRADPLKQCQNHISRGSTDDAMDVIELSFRYIDRKLRRVENYKLDGAGITQTPDDAISELNARFREHSIGFQYEGGELIRVDSQYIHAEAVKPVLHVLADPAFAGADAEFRSAHEHYRSGKMEEAMEECLKSLESTMKIICDLRGWPYAATAAAKDLVEVIFTNDLIPGYLRSEFSALRSTLESGVPTVRNRSAGHGQGSTIRAVPGYLAAYCMHTTAASILLLCEAHRARP